MPLPLPLAPELTVNQVALLVAVHWQPVGAETATDPAYPLLARVIAPTLIV